MSRDRTAVVPRAATPRDANLAAAIAQLRAQRPEWECLAVIGDEVLAQGKDVATLREDLATRTTTISALKKWIAGSLVTALIAGAAAFRAWGRNEGLAEAAKAQAAEYRERVQVLEQRVQDQALDIARLQALSARPTGTWAPIPRRRTTVADIDHDQGDHTP